MLPDDELKDLAANIAQYGLIHPIVLGVLDGDECILDGRNRYAACEMAGVEPEFVIYDGDDPHGYVLAANITRRHMTKGQQAMVIAQACLVSKQPQREAGAQHGVSATRIAQASTVIKHAPDYVTLVVSGAMSLDDAYSEAKARKEKAAEAERLLAELRDVAPDLADQVTEGSVTAQQAYKKWREREAEQERQRRQRSETATARLCDYLWHVAQWRRGGLATAIAQDFDPAMNLAGRTVTWQTLLDARAAIDEMIAVFQQRGLAEGGQR
jgi:hypothetical protein